MGPINEESYLESSNIATKIKTFMPLHGGWKVQKAGQNMKVLLKFYDF